MKALWAAVTAAIASAVGWVAVVVFIGVGTLPATFPTALWLLWRFAS